MSVFYENKNIQLINDDSLMYMKTLKDESIDVIVADPPYFLSNNGVTNSGGKQVSVNKGEWDEINQTNYSTSEEFNNAFLKEAKRILKKDGTIWVFGTMHNIFEVGYLMNKNDYRILNNITWRKLNPPPNLGRRMFTHSTENIIWASKSTKSKHFFNYDLMREQNQGKQMKDVWETPIISKKEKVFGKHPTQKPISILMRMIEASTSEDMVVLDPFVGSGTTAVACEILNRKCIGIDLSAEYLEIAKQRIIAEEGNLF